MSGALFHTSIDYLARYDLAGAGAYELRVLLRQHEARVGFDAGSEAVVVAVRAELARRCA